MKCEGCEHACGVCDKGEYEIASVSIPDLIDGLYFAVSVDGETIRQESMPFDSAKDALSFYECFKNNPKYEDKKLKIAKIVEYTEI